MSVLIMKYRMRLKFMIIKCRWNHFPLRRLKERMKLLKIKIYLPAKWGTFTRIHRCSLLREILKKKMWILLSTQSLSLPILFKAFFEAKDSTKNTLDHTNQALMYLDRPDLNPLPLNQQNPIQTQDPDRELDQSEA